MTFVMTLDLLMKFFFTLLVRLFSFVDSKNLLFVEKTSGKAKVCKQRKNIIS